MDITDLIGETTEYDKKLLLEEKRPRSWLKSVSAFANGSGGMLIFWPALRMPKLSQKKSVKL